MRTLIGVIATCLVLSMLVSLCSPAKGDFAGHEYMPDMVHPVGYEANVYTGYKHITWDEESVRTKLELAQPRKPVKGTVARGMTSAYYGGDQNLGSVRGTNASNAIAAQPNGSAPYYYGNSDAERERAKAGMTSNPYAPTQKEYALMGKVATLEAQLDDVGADTKRLNAQIASLNAQIKAEGDKILAVGKNLYNIQCGICHGEKGDGAGYLVRDGGAYPAAPANFKGATFLADGDTDGRYYHAIMQGKGVMGSYADKLSYEERWAVIRYIRKLQK